MLVVADDPHSSIHGALVVKLVEAFHMSGFGMCGQLWPMHQKEQLLQLTFPVQTIHIVST
jgi:hypothetical protein